MVNIPLFPSLRPPLVDNEWFNVDVPSDNADEVNQLEQEHHTWLQSIVQKYSDINPIGRTASELMEDEEDDDEDEDNDDDSSESHDDDDEDEIEMDISQERNSPPDGNIRTVQEYNSL